MKAFILINVLLLTANFVRGSTEEKKEEIKNENEPTKNNSKEEKASETYNIPSYALPDSGPHPNQHPIYPDTPVYSSLYPVKAHNKHEENYLDYEYDSTLSLTRNIPGEPGKDYPVFSSVPLTNFHCRETGHPGFYADVDTGCQVWHYCQPDGRHDAFLCPNGTIFDQRNRVCNWWYNVNCQESHYWYAINHDLYRVPKKHIPLEAEYYPDHQYLASKVIETKAKPPFDDKDKLHPAVIVKIPKKNYSFMKKFQKSAISEEESVINPPLPPPPSKISNESKGQ